MYSYYCFCFDVTDDQFSLSAVPRIIWFQVGIMKIAGVSPSATSVVCVYILLWWSLVLYLALLLLSGLQLVSGYDNCFLDVSVINDTPLSQVVSIASD